MEKKISQARAAQAIWESLPLAKRKKWLKNFQKLLVQESDKVIQAIAEDTGKPSMEALSIEITPVLMTAAYYRSQADKLLKPQRVGNHWLLKNKSTQVFRYPYGLVGIIGPSNVPFLLTIGDALPALLAGNAVLLKPSEKTPRSAQIGLDLALEAGLPENVLQIITGGHETAEDLVRHVDFIFFTGSAAAGEAIAKQAGEKNIPSVLELGGKAPMIVLEDADLERAARACIWGKFAHAGQHCVAVERVYVDHKIAGHFIDNLKNLASGLRPEDFSPLNAPGALEKLKGLIEDATQKGADIVYQNDMKEAGPTILTQTNHTMRVMKEEIFGPLLPVMSFSNFQNLLALVNDSETGLSASVFTKDKAKATVLAKKINAGNISINDCMDHFMALGAPFGGWKKSGRGVRHSPEGLLQFTRPKTVFTHRFGLPKFKSREFWWFPYEKKNETLLKKLNKFFFG